MGTVPTWEHARAATYARRTDMTIEEYLRDVKRIYYQLSVIVKGKQLLADGNNLLLEGDVSRLTDILDDNGRLKKVRFSTLYLPPATEIDMLGEGFAVINYGDVRLTIWPKGDET